MPTATAALNARFGRIGSLMNKGLRRRSRTIPMDTYRRQDKFLDE